MTPQAAEFEAPGIYLCDMSRQVMRDPVISSHGYTFEKSAIMGWLELGNNFCPCSGKRMSVIDLVAARSLRKEINRWRVQNGLSSDIVVGMTVSVSDEGTSSDQDDCLGFDEGKLKESRNSQVGPLRRLREAFKVVPRAA